MKKFNFEGGQKLSREEMKKVGGAKKPPKAGCSLAVCTSNEDCGWACRCTPGGTSKFCQTPVD